MNRARQKSTIVWVITISLLLAASIYSGFPYRGRVVDKATGEPIENAVIVRSWVREIPTPGGPSSMPAGMEEVLTDGEGEFATLGKLHFPSIPFFYQVSEQESIVYKPGYKLLVLHDKKRIMELERIPTFLGARKQEADYAKMNACLDSDHSKIFRRIISREEEFIQSSNSPFENAAYPIQKAPERSPRIILEFTGPKIVGSGQHDSPGLIVSYAERGQRKTPTTTTGSARITREDWHDSNIKVIEDRGMPASERIKAASHLGYSNNTKAVLPLMSALEDADRGVRRAAARSLGKISDTRSIPALISALRDKETGVRIEAAMALGNLNDARAIGPLIQSFSDANVKGNARISLLKIGEPAVEPLIGALKNENKRIREEAAVALGEMADERAIEPLANTLGSDDREVSSAVVVALGNFIDPRATKALITALRVDDNYFNALVQSAIYKIGSAAVEEMISLLGNSDAKLREDAAMILTRIKDPRAVVPLIKALQDENPRVGNWAASALAEIKDSQAVEPLLSIVGDDGSAIRSQASKAIIKIGAAAVKPLLGSLTHDHSYIRWLAAWHLGRIRDPSAVDALITVLNDKVSEVRWIAIDALAEIRDEKAVDRLKELCFDEDHGISAKAEASLTRITGAQPCRVDEAPFGNALYHDDPS